jgi:hypothetical protein
MFNPIFFYNFDFEYASYTASKCYRLSADFLILSSEKDSADSADSEVRAADSA